MSVTEDIKARLDIVNFLSPYMQLKKAGRNYTALCPFHAEKSPSFVVFPESQTWRCFGACGDGGDIFNFIMKQEGLDFAQALRTLAEKAGVELHERTPEQSQRDEHLDKLRGLLEETTRFFHEKLQKAPEAEHARAYTRKRGLSAKTITEFKIGFAPDDWRETLDHLVLLGYSEQEVIDAGVAVRNEEKDRVYDRFRNRLVIPICDGRGQVIAFGARALNPNDTPKYLNSSQTSLFDKGATLFALHLARRTIRENEMAVIVEGYMDALQAHQGGFTNVVAQMGTALTEQQLRQLSKYVRRLVLALDPDAAGAKATLRGVEVARKTLSSFVSSFDARALIGTAGKLDIEIMVMTLPEGQDPDDLIRDNPKRWQELVETAQPVEEYIISMGAAQLTKTSSLGEREQVARDLLPILIGTENVLHSHRNIQWLAQELRLPPETLIEWARPYRRSAGKVILKDQGFHGIPQSNSSAQDDGQAHQPVIPALTRTGFVVERYCLGMLIQRPGLWALANRKLRELATLAPAAQESLGPLCADDFVVSDHRMIFDSFLQALAQDDQEHMEYLQEHLPYDLYAVVEELLVEQMTIYKGHLIVPMHSDLDAIQRETQRIKTLMGRLDQERPQSILEQKVLELRKLRLGRENLEIQFLQQDAGPDASETYDQKVFWNNLAIRHIDNVLKADTIASLQTSKQGYKGGAARRG